MQHIAKLKKLQTDSEKFEAIYSTYNQMMFKLAYSITKDEWDAEDTVQMALVSIFENIRRIDDISSPETKSFIKIITRNKAIDLMRKKQKNIPFETADKAICIDFDPCNKVLAAINKLPVRNRDIMLLKYDNGYTTEEISNMLGIKIVTVQKIITRSKSIIRKEIENNE